MQDFRIRSFDTIGHGGRTVVVEVWQDYHRTSLGWAKRPDLTLRTEDGMTVERCKDNDLKYIVPSTGEILTAVPNSNRNLA